MEKKKIFYGWIIVAAGCVIMAATMGILSNCNSLFIKPISEDLGISRQAVSAIISLLSFGSMAASFFAGRIFNETNIIRIMKMAVIVMVLSCFASSFATDIRMLYVTFAINGVTMCLTTTLPMTFILNNWFKDKVGYALGLASMGSGFGGALFSAIAGQLITRLGWRMTYRILALSIMITAVPCIFLFLRLRPEEMGLEPYREQHEAAEQPQESTVSAAGYTYSEARRLPLFWILCAAAVILGLCMNGMYSTVSANLQDNGYSLAFSANFLSICMLVMAASKILLGKIFDRFGVRIGFCWACLALFLATLGLLFCRVPAALVLICIGIGFGFIFGAVVFPLSIPLIFGKKDYRAIMGPYASLISLGGVFGPIVFGRIYDMTGSYNPGYVFNLVIVGIVILVMLRILPNRNDQFS